MAVKEFCSQNGPKVRPAERPAICRACDGRIQKGDVMVTMYSWRNTGQFIHFHPECVERMAALVKESDVHTD